MRHLVFGKKRKHTRYTKRDAVYGVIFDAEHQLIAVVRTSRSHYFLPGGGIETGEADTDCLEREVLEEIGATIQVVTRIGQATQYFYSKNESVDYQNDATFYLCTLQETVDAPSEEDHQLEWVSPVFAIDQLLHDHHRWAVQEALNQMT